MIDEKLRRCRRMFPTITRSKRPTCARWMGTRPPRS